MINMNEFFHKKHYISNDINSYTNSRCINIDKNMNNINSIQEKYLIPRISIHKNSSPDIIKKNSHGYLVEARSDDTKRLLINRYYSAINNMNKKILNNNYIDNMVNLGCNTKNSKHLILKANSFFGDNSTNNI